MKRTPLVLLGLLLLAACPVFAAGLIIVDNPPDLARWSQPPRIVPPGPGPHPIPPRPMPRPPEFIPPRPYVFSPLETTFTKIHTRITDQIAVSAIDQEFYNPNPQRLEGTFLFPVPKGAHIGKFSMEIDGRQVEAELLAADKARGIYEDIVRRMRDPALLEYSGRDVFKVRIFPIEPHSRKRIKLSYTELLKSDTGLVRYLHPLNTEKYSAKPIKTLSLKIDLDSKRALKSIYSPSHKVEIRRDGERKAMIGFEASEVRPDTDFQLFFQPEEGDVGMSLLTHRTADGEGYFLLLASPGFETRDREVVVKDVAFVLDTSGSMAGAKLEQAKKALLFCVENLNDGDRFEIIRFSTEVEPLFEKLTNATRANRLKAAEFIKDLRPIGGTAIDDALRKAVSIPRDGSERPYVVIFLTDGRPTVGTTDEDAIVANVSKSGVANTRVFCFGIGTDVNTHLLDRITEDTRAFSQYVLPEEDIEVKVSNFFAKIKEPVLANVKLTFPQDVRVAKLYPSPLPDLFKGEQLVLAGRYSGHGKGQIVIEGTINSAARKLSFDVAFPDRGSDHEFIPRLWATRRVGYLLDEIRLRGENQELRDEVTELARQYGIVTPYTAYLIVEDEKQRGVPMTTRVIQDDRMAARYGATAYDNLRRERSGDAAVAGARSTLALKQATGADMGIATGKEEAARQFYSPGSQAPAITPAAAGRPMAGGAYGFPARAATEAQVQQQTQFVNGRTFFQNGSQWIDGQVQKRAQAQRIRIAFNSPEYFDLLAKQPDTRAWLALGQNVQFVLNDTIYDIYEATN